jgi:hypothetical protein
MSTRGHRGKTAGKDAVHDHVLLERCLLNIRPQETNRLKTFMLCNVVSIMLEFLAKSVEQRRNLRIDAITYVVRADTVNHS